MIDKSILKHFGVCERVFIKALKANRNAQGYIMGAISEILLKEYLEEKGYTVCRIVEKPAGGNKAKSDNARGDFYIRKKGVIKNDWLVVESKGLKSNSEFRGGKLDSPEKVFNFLRNRIFGAKSDKGVVLNRGHDQYLRKKKAWEKDNPERKFPKFKWNQNFPGAECYDLNNIWDSEKRLKDWVFSLDENCFSEQAYRTVEGAVSILETHQPSRRKGRVTNIRQAAPLVTDFNIMSVDLFLRTRKHEFVFMNSESISHSPSSPEHLYQNYMIDILVKDIKKEPIVNLPWYRDIDKCIKETNPTFREIDYSQIDAR